MNQARNTGLGMALVTALLGWVGSAQPPALAQGGCGSVCLPLDAIDPEQATVRAGTFRVFLTSEYAAFDNFREGDDDLANPAGAEADLHFTTAVLDYGVADRWTLSLLLPYVRKIQHNNALGRRAAEGIGDVSLFGRYQFRRPTEAGIGPSLAAGLGVKFPTGDTEQPGGSVPDLPQAFQNGSGAYDLVPELSYFQTFNGFSLFGGTFARLPLEANKFEYEFGNEYEAHFGVRYPLGGGLFELLASLDYLYAERDEDDGTKTPPPLKDGNDVLPTGGRFLDVTPGVRIRLGARAALQARVFVPVYEHWNGDPNRFAGMAMQPVGQVAPDLSWQLTFAWSSNAPG